MIPLFFIFNEEKIHSMTLYKAFMVTFFLYLLHKNSGFISSSFFGDLNFFVKDWYYILDLVILSVMLFIYSLFYTSMTKDPAPRLIRIGSLILSIIPVLLLIISLLIPSFGSNAYRILIMKTGVVILSGLLLFSASFLLCHHRKAINTITGIMMKATAIFLIIFSIPLTLQIFYNYEISNRFKPLCVENLYFAAVNLANIFILARNNFLAPLPDTRKLPEFSLREMEIIRLIKKGKGNKQIAYELDIREQTVRNHINSMLKKTKTKNRVELLARIKADKLL